MLTRQHLIKNLNFHQLTLMSYSLRYSGDITETAGPTLLITKVQFKCKCFWLFLRFQGFAKNAAAKPRLLKNLAVSNGTSFNRSLAVAKRNYGGVIYRKA